MKSILYKTFFLVIVASAISLFECSLYAGPLSIGDETALDARLESPDFDMDQSGDSTNESDGAQNWEDAGKGSLSAASEVVSLTPVDEEKVSEPEVLTVEEATKIKVEPLENQKLEPSTKEKMTITDEAEKDFQNEEA